MEALNKSEMVCLTSINLYTIDNEILNIAADIYVDLRKMVKQLVTLIY
jgi:hypothetical protein